MTKERPILFKAAMVRAILSGQKTQTRRVVKMPEKLLNKPLRYDGVCFDCPDFHYFEEIGNAGEFTEKYHGGVKCPYGMVGDELWVRESFSVLNICDGWQNPDVCDDFIEASCAVRYADNAEAYRELIVEPDMNIDDLSQAKRASKKKTVPSIHMPRWASRIQLRITNIRVERLIDISEQDALAEGIERFMDRGRELYKDYLGRHHALYSPQFAFNSLWKSINGIDSWDANPWVWVVEFERI